ncbi:MAG TPA: GNAT family N-acetyltransferase [Paracoccaceae bacterium]|nr:GNAT family N-acetyltransferase [Paracoccaceae bacterium]
MIERLEGAAAMGRSAEIARLLAESFEDPSQRWPADSVASTLATSGAMALIAPGGCALLQVAAGEAELLTIAVAPPARRRGLGARLLAACLAEASERGADLLHLEVGAANVPAVALYESAGFTRTGLRPGYYAGKDGRVDALLMSRPAGPADGDTR